MKKAFTLSEVLLTMGIIGIVAAMTMPGIVIHYHQQEYVSQLAKSLSQYEQAMQNIMFRHECTDIICTGLYDNNSGWNTKFDEEIKKSIKIVKTAPVGTAMNSEIKSKVLKPRDTFIESNLDWRSTAGYKFMTPDGAMYVVEPKGCTKVDYDTQSTLTNICAEITIDVNSERRPNQYGRDIFKFVAGQNGHLYAMYGLDYSKAVAETTTGDKYWRTKESLCGAAAKNLNQSAENISGDGCAARIMENGWKMNY